MKGENQKDQSARFCAEVERMIADGELNPTEANTIMDRVLRQSASDKTRTPA